MAAHFISTSIGFLCFKVVDIVAVVPELICLLKGLFDFSRKCLVISLQRQHVVSSCLNDLFWDRLQVPTRSWTRMGEQSGDF